MRLKWFGKPTPVTGTKAADVPVASKEIAAARAMDSFMLTSERRKKRKVIRRYWKF